MFSLKHADIYSIHLVLNGFNFYIGTLVLRYKNWPNVIKYFTLNIFITEAVA